MLAHVEPLWGTWGCRWAQVLIAICYLDQGLMNGPCQKFDKLSGGLYPDISLHWMISTISIIPISQMRNSLQTFQLQVGVLLPGTPNCCLVPLPSVDSVKVLCSGERLFQTLPHGQPSSCGTGCTGHTSYSVMTGDLAFIPIAHV